MSVYKRQGSPYWHYDFQIDGLRFRGSTRTADKGVARSVEAQARTDAVKQVRLGVRKPMTVNAAFGRYWEEAAKHHANAGTEDYQLAKLLAFLGEDRLLSQVDDPVITEYIARRRAKVADASVNREVELLRRVFRRADGLWKADIGDMPKWKDHLLDEPDERVRCLSEDEEDRLFAHLRPDFHPLVRFCIMTGVRLGNAITLTWTQVDYQASVVTFRVKSRKPGGKVLDVPLTPSARVLLAQQHGNHPIFVFTYECKRSRGQRMKGERYPFSRNGWRKDWRRALEAAGIEDFRFHDTRHTAATRVLRATGNMKAVQKMLGHSDITTTARYAHVETKDVRAAMEMGERHNIPALASPKVASS